MRRNQLIFTNIYIYIASLYHQYLGIHYNLSLTSLTQMLKYQQLAVMVQITIMA